MSDSNKEPSVRDCLGRTVRIGDTVRLLPDPAEQFPYKDPNDHRVTGISSERTRVTLWNGRTSKTSLLELRFGRPDACDQTIVEQGLQDKANRNDPDALFKLGMLYQPVYWRNETGQLDGADIRTWFKSAAEQGHAAAQFEYAQFFDEEINAEAPTKIEWLKRSAKNGHPLACMELAYICTEWGSDELQAVNWYRKGRQLGAPHDMSNFIFFPGGDKMGKGWVERLKRSARKSDSAAQYELAKLFALGSVPWEVPLNVPIAYAWAAIASGYSGRLPSPDEFERPPGHWDGYGKPERLARILACVLNDGEMEEASEAFAEISATFRKPRFFGLF